MIANNGSELIASRPRSAENERMLSRPLSLTDRILIEVERAIGTAFGAAPSALRPSPAIHLAEADLSEDERRHAAGLMRVNHTGEVCAQAL